MSVFMYWVGKVGRTSLRRRAARGKNRNENRPCAAAQRRFGSIALEGQRREIDSLFLQPGNIGADRFAEFVREHPGHKVISYVNTSAATKAVTDVVVTSGNARRIVESFPADQPLIFGPDRNLGSYLNSVTPATGPATGCFGTEPPRFTKASPPINCWNSNASTPRQKCWYIPNARDP